MSTEAAGQEPSETNQPKRSNDEEMFFMAIQKQGNGPGGSGGGIPCPRACGNSFSDPHVLAAHVNGQHFTHSTTKAITDGRRK